MNEMDFETWEGLANLTSDSTSAAKKREILLYIRALKCEDSYYNTNSNTSTNIANGSILSATNNNNNNSNGSNLQNSINTTTSGSTGGALISQQQLQQQQQQQQQQCGTVGGMVNVPTSISVQQFNAMNIGGSATNSGAGNVGGGVVVSSGTNCGNNGQGGGGVGGGIGGGDASPMSNVPHSQSAPHQLGQPPPLTPLAQHHQALAQQLQQRFAISNNNEPRKDKTDAPHGGNGTLSPNTEQPSCQSSMLPPPGGGQSGGPQSNHTHVQHVSGGGTGGGHGGNGNSGNTSGSRDQHDGVHIQNSKLERPNTLGTNKVSRRVNICYHNEH
ncbi:PREDICTED: mediator of RNA polymerase II transcription subunit 12-like, partial [Rhagoletis zephyria]|uniref:mediator of RNA polymerase II transcription subunit 12-like n=1 Tax=Rhagoletis zephyria TaxID=28612 RepID=UPI0008114941